MLIAGYVTRWRFTPWATALIYAGMAAVCAYETFFLLTNESRFLAMAIEYTEYALILAFLFLSGSMREHFAQRLEWTLRIVLLPGQQSRLRAGAGMLTD